MKTIELTNLDIQEISASEQKKQYGGIIPLIPLVAGASIFASGAVFGLGVFTSLWAISSKLS